jgi:crotonobetainyl-CoA:carnitine CoA-transferase CaiB-like acyl-CoA transferase
MTVEIDAISPRHGVLHGIRVIDLTQGIAGPFCTKVFADYGADVIKIERPGGGDPCRGWAPFLGDVPNGENSGLFLHLNTNKRSVVLDLKAAQGKQVFHRLVSEADIVLESFSPGTMTRFGLGYERLSTSKPGLVMTSISNFGSSGPYRDYKLSEIVLYAMGGMMHGTGQADREPVKLALTVEQFYCGMVAAGATMGAHVGSLIDGQGRHLDLSLFEMMVGSQDRAAQSHTAYQYTGRPIMVRRRAESVTRSLLPGGVYPVADGYVQFSSLAASNWFRVCNMLGRPEMANDPHFVAPENFFGNVQVKEEVETILLEWLLQRTKREVMEASQAAGYPCGALNTMADVYADPNLAARRYFATVDHPATGPLRYPGAPFVMSETPWRPGRAPLLGEHTQQILSEYGYSAAEVRELQEAGVV